MTNKRNASGAPDPTAYEAIKNTTADYAREVKLRRLLQIFAHEWGFNIERLKLVREVKMHE